MKRGHLLAFYKVAKYCDKLGPYMYIPRSFKGMKTTTTTETRITLDKCFERNGCTYLINISAVIRTILPVLYAMSSQV